MAPVIGRRGVAALLNRSLHLAARTHSWIEGMTDADPSGIDVDALESVLARQTSADAAAGGLLFLTTFNNSLMNLIGPSLTGRFLHPVWATSLSGTSAQDTMP